MPWLILIYADLAGGGTRHPTILLALASTAYGYGNRTPTEGSVFGPPEQSFFSGLHASNKIEPSR